MTNVMLVVPLDREIPNTTGFAIARAKAGAGQLIAAVMASHQEANRLATALTNSALVGERVSDSVASTVERERRLLAQAVGQQIAIEAAKSGVMTTIAIESGDPREACERLMETHNAQMIVFPAARRSWAARVWGEADADFRPGLFCCEVHVIQE